MELCHARDTFEWELTISQGVQASTLKAINLGSDADPRTLKIAKDLASDEWVALVGLLTDYQDVLLGHTPTGKVWFRNIINTKSTFSRTLDQSNNVVTE